MITAEDVLTGFYTEDDELTVSALQLQKIIQRMERAERELKICKQKKEALETAVEVLKCRKPEKVSLDIYT